MTYRKVKIIEKLPFDLSDRTNILLTYANQKSASIVLHMGDNFNRDRNTYELSEDKSNILHHKFKRIGLLTHFTDKITHEPEYFEHDGRKICQKGQEFKHIYVARDKLALDYLIESFAVRDHNGVGLALGFPQTAVDAFCGVRPAFMGNAHYSGPLGHFTFWVQSQEYFHEELESTAQRWHDTVKKLSPKLYEEIKEYCNNNLVVGDGVSWRQLDEDGTLFLSK